MGHKHLSTDYSLKSAFEHYRWKGRYIKYELLSISIIILNSTGADLFFLEINISKVNPLC